jgi:hypothetical protein
MFLIRSLLADAEEAKLAALGARILLLVDDKWRHSADCWFDAIDV